MYNLIDNWISMSLARLKTRRDYYQVVLLGILVYGERKRFLSVTLGFNFRNVFVRLADKHMYKEWENPMIIKPKICPDWIKSLMKNFYYSWWNVIHNNNVISTRGSVLSTDLYNSILQYALYSYKLCFSDFSLSKAPNRTTQPKIWYTTHLYSMERAHIEHLIATHVHG